MPSRLLVLVKHALPVLEGSTPPREWPLSDEGKAQAARLAERLGRFAPFRLSTSPEPKALQTSEIVAGELGIPLDVVEGLREIDRPAQPITSTEEHRALNAPIFWNMEVRVTRMESGREALERFEAAVRGVLRSAGDDENVVIVTHGTVLSLFVSAHNPIDAFNLWATLDCSALVVLDASTLSLVETDPG
jgi:broad specificity phosphatase PhoE